MQWAGQHAAAVTLSLIRLMYSVAGTVREKARGWSEAEEALFLEALDLFGRDWKAGAAHVATRDVRAFTSHAQKHFIRMCIAGQRVPHKVSLQPLPPAPNWSAMRAVDGWALSSVQERFFFSKHCAAD